MCRRRKIPSDSNNNNNIRNAHIVRDWLTAEYGLIILY